MNSRVLTRAALPALLAVSSFGGVRQAAAQASRAIPADTVVRVRLDDRINSRDARVGDRVMATVVPSDYSGFPTGTRFEGAISEARASREDQPGVIDMDFRRALLPDGTRVSINGSLASLSDDDVRRTSDGRIESRRRSSGGNGKIDLKWIGYGAAGGAILGELFGSNFLKGALLGGLGGAVYGYLNRDKGGSNRVTDVSLDPGTEFGIRMENRVAFDDRTNYRYSRYDRTADRGNRGPDGRVAGDRQEWRFNDTAVRLNGRAVTFTEARPLNLNGVLYVPLRPVAQAANLRFDHYAGEENFTLQTPDGQFRGRVGEKSVRSRGGIAETLDDAAVSINGEIYVPTEYLSRVTHMRVNWNRRQMRLDLETDAVR